MPGRARSERFVVRSAGSVIAFWIGMAVLVAIVALPVVQSDWSLLGFVLPPVLLLAWILWIALYRPAVHYDAAAAVVVNMGRTHRLPWGHVTAIRQGIGLIFQLDTGTSVVAVGAPAPRRPGILMGAIDRRTRPTQEFHHDAELLDGYRLAAPPSDEPVSSRWEVVSLAVGALLVVAVVVEIVLGI